MTGPAIAARLAGLEIERGATVIGPLDLEIRAGEVLAFVGANGAGKTTTFKALCGLLRPSKGTAEVFGEPVVAGRRPEGLGALIEEPRFYPWLSGHANLELSAAAAGVPADRIASLLAKVGLAEAGSRRVSGYSQGMRQRLGIARVLLGAPQLVLLDEPTNGLDPPGMRWVRELVRELAEEGRTVIVSSHLLHELEQVADHLAVMSAGALLVSGPAAEVIGGYGSLEDLYFDLAA